jgi:hypothetical protein
MQMNQKRVRATASMAQRALSNIRSIELDAPTAAKHLAVVHDYVCRHEEGENFSHLLSMIGLDERRLREIEERIKRGLWLIELQKHPEVLITVPDHIDGHRMIGEIKEMTREGIQFHWLAQCTDPIPGPVGEQTRFRRITTTTIPFNLIDAHPEAGGGGSLYYTLPDGRYLSLNEPHACMIPSVNVEGLTADESTRMGARYAASRRPRWP